VTSLLVPEVEKTDEEIDDLLSTSSRLCETIVDYKESLARQQAGVAGALDKLAGRIGHRRD
jgi:hypothetical protein